MREGLATLRGALSAVGRSLPRHVQKELEGFLGCGDPVNAFACPGCGGALALRCLVLNPRATRRILDGLRRATGPPGLDAAGDDRRA